MRNSKGVIYKFNAADGNSGAQGKVYIGLDLTANRKVAIKEARLETRCNFQPDNIQRAALKVQNWGFLEEKIHLIGKVFNPSPEKAKLLNSGNTMKFQQDVANEQKMGLKAGLLYKKITIKK